MPPPKPRSVDLICEEPRLRISGESLNRCVALLDRLLHGALPAGSLHIAFVDGPTCSDLHARFFDDPEITDVMTFPGDPEDDHAGDIAICPLVAFTESEARHLPFAEELTLYLVHACLHLAGMDDLDETGRAAMRARETACLASLREADGWLEASWSDPPYA